MFAASKFKHTKRLTKKWIFLFHILLYLFKIQQTIVEVDSILIFLCQQNFLLLCNFLFINYILAFFLFLLGQKSVVLLNFLRLGAKEWILNYNRYLATKNVHQQIIWVTSSTDYVVLRWKEMFRVFWKRWKLFVGDRHFKTLYVCTLSQ